MEILVAAGIFVTAVSVFLVSFGFLDDISVRASDKTQVGLLLEEGAEAVMLLRDQGFDTNIVSLEEGEPYYLYWDGSAYQVAEGEVAIMGRYLRTITVYAAARNGSDAYAESGTNDPNTKRVVIEVRRTSDDEILATSEMLIHNSYE